MSPRRARTGGDREQRLEVMVVPVSDVDRAKAFYPDRVAFVVDHDTPESDTARVVPLTPPGSACSTVIGTGLRALEPGSPPRPPSRGA